MNDYPARETPGIGGGLVWTGIAAAQLPLEHSSLALDGADFLDSVIFDSPSDDFSGGTAHINGHAIVVPRNTIHFRTV